MRSSQPVSRGDDIGIAAIIEAKKMVTVAKLECGLREFHGQQKGMVAVRRRAYVMAPARADAVLTDET